MSNPNKKRGLAVCGESSAPLPARKKVVVSSLSTNASVKGAVPATSAAAASIESCLAELEDLVTGGERAPPLSADATSNTAKSVEALHAQTDADESSSRSLRHARCIATAASPSASDSIFPTNSSNKLWDPLLGRSHPLRKNWIDQVQTWNAAMNVWATKGKYMSGLLPLLEIEIARHFQVAKLSSFLLEACHKGKTRKRTVQMIILPAFERWLLDSKIEERKMRGSSGQSDGNGTVFLESTSSDVVLSYFKPQSPASLRLSEELKELGVLDDVDIKKLMKDLCRKTETAIGELQSQALALASKVPLKKGERIELERQDQMCNLYYHCKRWKKPFRARIAASHYNKLWEIFHRVHNSSAGSGGTNVRLTDGGGRPTKALHAFNYLIMTLLVRLSSLSGGQLLLESQGGFLQSSIPRTIFHVIADFINIPATSPLLECAASPLNTYLPNYCSACPDIDWHFGSVGDFLSAEISSGCCQIHLPLTAGFILACIDRMEYNLQQADRKNRVLSFVIIVPTVHEHDNDKSSTAKRLALPAFRRIMSSSFLRWHTILPAGNHFLLPGAQYLLRELTRQENLFDTSVILLQSRQARQHPLDLNALQDRILLAAACGCGSEKQEQTKKDAGDHTSSNMSKKKSKRKLSDLRDERNNGAMNQAQNSSQLLPGTVTSKKKLAKNRTKKKKNSS